MYINEKRVSRHAMKDCSTFLKLQEAVGFKKAEAKKSRIQRSHEQHVIGKSTTNKWSPIGTGTTQQE
jgi:hypothetical protein